MTVDDMLDAARASDPDGYSREALRAMYGGARRFRYRAMAALAAAVGVPASEFPELRLAYARFLIDDRAQGLDRALENLARLDPNGELDPDQADPTGAPIQGRREVLDDAIRKARSLERRRGRGRRT